MFAKIWMVFIYSLLPNCSSQGVCQDLRLDWSVPGDAHAPADIPGLYTKQTDVFDGRPLWRRTVGAETWNILFARNTSWSIPERWIVAERAHTSCCEGVLHGSGAVTWPHEDAEWFYETSSGQYVRASGVQFTCLDWPSTTTASTTTTSTTTTSTTTPTTTSTTTPTTTSTTTTTTTVPPATTTTTPTSPTTTTPAASTPSDEESTKTSPGGLDSGTTALIGGAIGGFVVIFVSVVLLIICLSRRKRNNRESRSNAEDPTRKHITAIHKNSEERTQNIYEKPRKIKNMERKEEQHVDKDEDSVYEEIKPGEDNGEYLTPQLPPSGIPNFDREVKPKPDGNSNRPVMNRQISNTSSGSGRSDATAVSYVSGASDTVLLPSVQHPKHRHKKPLGWAKHPDVNDYIEPI